jgi:hypothetical protein
MYYDDLLTEALEVWCPTFPRRHSAKMNNTRGWGQKPSNSYERIIRHLKEIKGEAPGFVSVYSFPHGHTSESSDNIPRIDTLMFDLDFNGAKNDSEREWRREMTALLVRTRMVARQLIEDDLDQYWRASLSGHKGIHLYVDFPAIDVREGSAGQFRKGVEKYTNDLVETIQSEADLPNLDDSVDVMSGEDFARMTRLPNTIHEGATKRFGETRFCVPISIQELAEIRVDGYVALTQRPRYVPDGCRRVESQKVHDVLVQDIRSASAASSAASWGSSGTSGKDTQRIASYEKDVNEGFTLQSLRVSKRLRPICWEFHDRDDRFDYGEQSHLMELNCIAEMISHKMPVDLMVEFFAVDEDFREEYTRGKIADVLSYNYSPFKLKTLRNRAGVFFKNK